MNVEIKVPDLFFFPSVFCIYKKQNKNKTKLFVKQINFKYMFYKKSYEICIILGIARTFIL